MKKVLALIGGVALTAALAAPQSAKANLLVNGSLETGLTPDQFDMVTASTTKNTNALPGWTITSGSIDVTPNTYWQSIAGTYSVDLIGSPGVGKISQTLTTVVGDLYQMTFALAFNPQSLTGEENSIKHLVITATAGDSTVEGTQTYSGAAAAGATLQHMHYTAQTFLFTATSTTTFLSLAATLPSGLPSTYTASNVFCGPVVDNLDLEDLSATSTPPTVPEPASLSLLGLGAIGLLRRRSTRRA